MPVQHDNCKDTAFGTALTEAGFDGHRGRLKFGVAIGVDPGTVRRWVLGESKPGSEATRRAAASLLGKTTAELWPDDAAPVAEAA